ncbi:tetratricopeptide repeat protein [Thioclava litoralis]|uniref:Tetratricopeptide repeat protein n=1 Tax=Thioclava litoralis TaxID=3076557 RepID=A0ABZ1DWA3_9RHOB|nr:tetratricopeptide repeat protein [Thioclava sp. FTW29]
MSLCLPKAWAESAATHADSGVDSAFSELADPDNAAWARAQSDIERAWSRSGSAAMDLLLKRGEDALDAGDSEAAIEHLTALVDHDPDFAAGWNARAQAYYSAGLYGPAIADLAQTLRLEPRHWVALAGIGTILEETGDNKRALKAYQASFGLNPHQEDVKDAIDRLEKELGGKAL